MRRNGFTMVELIFVIIIIGILSVAAIPKFGDIKDRAKVSTEYSALSSLDGAIEGALEFHREDFANDIGIAWHGTDTDGSDITHKEANVASPSNVLGKILKKNESLKVVAILDLNNTGGTTADNSPLYDVIFIEGTASDSANGVKEQETSLAKANGKPDKNDVWVFNTSPVDIEITGTSVKDVNISSGELKLVDANETLTYSTPTKIGVKVAGADAVAATTTLP